MSIGNSNFGFSGSGTGGGGGGGTITGGGTLNYIALFTPSGTAIGNSILNQIADPDTPVITDVQIAGNFIPDSTASARKLGASSRRWDTIYMASNIDYSNDLLFKSGGNTNFRMSTTGNLFLADNKNIDVENTGSKILNFGIQNAQVINIGTGLTPKTINVGSATTLLDNINIYGNVLSQQVTNLLVKDKLFTVNDGGAVASGFNAGFEIQEGGVNTGWLMTNTTRDGWDFKAPAITGVVTLGLDLLTANRTAKIQNASGTIAYLSDITSSINGTLNYVAMFTPDGNHIGNSPIFVDSLTNYVGIGTITPTSKLQVVGVDATSANYSAKFENDTSNLYSITNNGINTWNSYYDGQGSGIANFTYATNTGGILNEYTTVDGVKWSFNEGLVNMGSFTNNGGYTQLVSKNRFTLKNYANISKLWMDDVNGYIGIGDTYFPASAQLHVQGQDNTAANYSFKAQDNVANDLFYVRNDGAVSSLLGLWIDGVRKLWTDSSLDTVFWNHGNSSPLNLGSGTRNTIVGNSDSNQPQFTTGGFNSVFGSYGGMNITSGAFNLVLANYNTVTPTTGSRNIILGQGGMIDPTKDSTLTFNGFSNNSNQVVFGSENYARYNAWYFGQGIEANKLSVGAFNMNWYATSTVSGLADVDATITDWIFNASQGTGKGIGGGFVWNVAPASLVSGSTLNAFVEAFRISKEGNIGVGVDVPLARFHNFGVNSTGVNQRLEPISGVIEDVIGATVNTTDATLTTLQTISIPNDTIYMIEARITCRKTAGVGAGTIGDGNGYIRTACYANIGGVVTLSGVVQTSFTGEAIVGFDANLIISGTNVLVSVTGALNDSVTWNTITRIEKVG